MTTTSKPKKHPLSILPLLLLLTSLFALARYNDLRPLTAPPLSTPPPSKPPHHNLRILQESNTLLSSLQHPHKATHFTTKATTFFNSRRCTFKFFITWISDTNSFGPRELLSIESIFKSHPNACLLIVSTSVTIRTLYPYLNRGYSVLTVSPDFAALFKNTPAELWFNNLINNRINPGEVPLGQNLSNLLRLVLLYKFGGIYVDADVIVMKKLSNVRNAIGAQAVDPRTGNWSRLNNAVMIFDKGHPLLYEFMKEFARSFDGNRWGFNGPYLVSRVAKRVEGAEGFEFRVLKPEAFYPVGWSRVKGWFEGPRGRRQSKWVAAKFERVMRESYGMHLWNRESRGVEVEEGSVVGRIVRECCVLCNFSVSSMKKAET